MRHGGERWLGKRGMGLRHGLEAWGREGCMGLKHGEGDGWGLRHGGQYRKKGRIKEERDDRI